MEKKEFAGTLLQLLQKGKMEEAEELCETVDFCRLRALRDREAHIPPRGYTAKEADAVIDNGPIAAAVLVFLRAGCHCEAEDLLKQYAA